MQLQSAWSRMHTYIQVGVALTFILQFCEILAISLQRMKARNALLVSRVSICPRERYRTFRKTGQRYTLFHYVQRKRGKNLPQRDVFPPHPPVFAVKPISHDFYTRVSRNLYPGLRTMHTRVSEPLRPGYSREVRFSEDFTLHSMPVQRPIEGFSTDFRGKTNVFPPTVSGR